MPNKSRHYGEPMAGASLPIPTERDVHRAVRAAYEACGCWVANFAQGYRPGGRRHATTRQTKGIPDLYVFPPVRNESLRPWWHEIKRPGGKQTPEQLAWMQRCHLFNVGIVVGGVAEVLTYLRLLGLVRA